MICECPINNKISMNNVTYVLFAIFLTFTLLWGAPGIHYSCRCCISLLIITAVRRL